MRAYPAAVLFGGLPAGSVQVGLHGTLEGSLLVVSAALALDVGAVAAPARSTQSPVASAAPCRIVWTDLVWAVEGAEAAWGGRGVLVQRPLSCIACTAWLLPADPPPAYALRGQGLRVPLLVGAGASAMGSATLLALAAVTSADTSAPGSQADLDARVASNHTFAISGAGLGAVAVALGTSAFVFGRW